jgi:hypothetical protein
LKSMRSGRWAWIRALNPRPLRHEPAHTNKQLHQTHNKSTNLCKIKASWWHHTCEVLNVDPRIPTSFALAPQQQCVLCRFLLTALILLILSTHTIYALPWSQEQNHTVSSEYVCVCTHTHTHTKHTCMHTHAQKSLKLSAEHAHLPNHPHTP